MKVTKAELRNIAAARGWTMVRTCPVCGHERWRPVLRAHRGCCLAQCGDCGFVFLNPRPPRSASDSGYHHDHVEALIPRLVDRGLLHPDLRPNDARLVQRYEKLINLTRALEPTTAVIDIGCGIGTSTLALRAGGIEAMGMELDEHFVRAANERLKIDVRRGDVTQPAQPRHPVATLNSVLEHIDEPVPFLEAIRRNVLQPGGALVVTVPNLASTEFVHHHESWPIISAQHVGYFTERTLAETATRAGFDVEQVWEPELRLRPSDPVELWARIALGHSGNVTGGIGMTLRSRSTDTAR